MQIAQNPAEVLVEADATGHGAPAAVFAAIT